MKQVQSQWSKGVNKRVSDRRGDPQRLSQLINARLQQRGSTLEVSRIQGFEEINNLGLSNELFYDAIMYDNNVILFSRSVAVTPRIRIYNVDTGSLVANLLIDGATEQIDYGKLILLEDTVFVTPFNKQLNFINGTWRINDFISTTPEITDSTTVISGTLDQNEDYWYKVRYVYYDGHITKSSFPVKLKTTTGNRTVELTIDAVTDLDGEFAEVEILRKKGSEDFFVIDRTQPQSSSYTFLDDGLPILSTYEEENYVWAKDSRTHDFVRDRIVKANNQYDTNEDSSEFDFSLNTAASVASGGQALPTWTDIELYNKVRKQDGTETFFNLQETLSTEIYPSTRLGYRQTGEYDGAFKENALYARFRPQPSPDAIEFNSLEIYNQNVPSIETAGEPEAEQNKPVNPHIFLGWKYIQAWDGQAFDNIVVTDEAWTVEVDGDSDIFVTGENAPSLTSEGVFPEVLTKTITSSFGINSAPPFSIGKSVKYKKKYEAIGVNGASNSAVYELAILDGIKEAVTQGKLKVRLKATNNVSGNLSTTRPDSEFIGFEANVVGILDTSSQETQVTEGVTVGTGPQDELLKSARNNHLYLVLENGTPFDDFDNASANNRNVKGGDIPNVDHRYEFELVGLREALTTNSFTSTTETELNFDYEEFTSEYKVVLTDYSDFETDAGVLLKAINTNEVESSTTLLDNLGWEKTIINNFEFVSFNEWNVLETLITRESLRQFENDYPNQLIWSQSFIPRSNASKVRNFDFENFKNISADYGEILDIEYIQNVLLVFCERGVNLVNVGEILTQQAGGEVFVDSSRFLTNDYWILKNVPNIQAKSIVQYENLLFFSDGRDVWKYEGGLQNITNGAIEIGGVASPACVSCASIDPLNKEYRLGTPNGTWAYSIELGEWMGPHSYKDSVSATYRDRMISIVGGNLVEHNTGNDFDGTPYNTVIAGVANDADDPTVTKLFRKFYVETQPTDASATFEYGKDENINESLALEQKPNKNNLYHVGVNNSNKNGRYLSWKITTTDQNFILSSIGLSLESKKRR